LIHPGGNPREPEKRPVEGVGPEGVSPDIFPTNPIRDQERTMARITVEDCLQKVNNRFALIHLSAKRVRQLRRGAEPLVQSKNKDIVVSLREIAAGKVRKAEPEDLERLLEEAEAAEALPEGPAPAAEADTAPVVSQEEASSEKA